MFKYWIDPKAAKYHNFDILIHLVNYGLSIINPHKVEKSMIAARTLFCGWGKSCTKWKNIPIIRLNTKIRIYIPWIALHREMATLNEILASIYPWSKLYYSNMNDSESH